MKIKNTALIFLGFQLALGMPARADSVAGVAMSDGAADAMYFYKRGDFAKAFKEFFVHAQNGDPIAESTLGRMHMRGEGTVKDCQQALFWLNRAEQHGSDTAENLMACCTPMAAAYLKTPRAQLSGTGKLRSTATSQRKTILVRRTRKGPGWRKTWPQPLRYIHRRHSAKVLLA